MFYSSIIVQTSKSASVLQIELRCAAVVPERLLCIQIRQLRGQKLAPRVGGGGSTNYQDLCLASPASAEGDYLSSDEDLLSSPLPANTLYPTLSVSCHLPARLDSEGSTDSEAEERVRTPPDPQQLYGSRVCTEALDN